MPHPTVKLAGKSFGFWTVLSQEPSRNKRSRWKCQCICGTIRVLDRHTLKYCSQSCGCLRLKPDAAVRRILTDYKFRSNRRGLEFALSWEQFKELTASNCYYCGSEPAQSKNVRYREPYFYNGIDRRDNRLGYTPSNCVPCCRLCNLTKGAKSERELLSWVSKIYHHRIISSPGNRTMTTPLMPSS